MGRAELRKTGARQGKESWEGGQGGRSAVGKKRFSKP